MIKVVVIAILLLIAAYCSYQVAAIVNWQKLLRNKQKQFGVTYDVKEDSSLHFMKQLRMVCVTCAALTLIVPAQILPFGNPAGNDAYLIADTNKKANESDIRGIAEDAMPPQNASPAEVTSSGLSKPVTTNGTSTITDGFVTTKTLSTLGILEMESSFLSDWNLMKEDLEAIEEIVIESYDTASETLTQARVKSLLKKELSLVDLIWDQEDYVVKVKLSSDVWLRLLLKNVKGNFYAYDEIDGQVYLLQ